MIEELKWDNKVAEEVSKRLEALFGNLPANAVQAAIEEFIDDYTSAVHGVGIMSTIREVRLASKGQCVTTQHFAKGRALLISSYGFKAISESQCKCGKAFLVLDECNKQDMENERID